MARIAFSIPGEPRGKDRPRARAQVVHTPTGPIAVLRIHSDPQTVRVEKAVRAEFKRLHPHHVPLTGPVMLRFTAVFPPLASFTKAQREAAARGELYHTSKPDKDNIEKLLVDALNGLAWVDDSQIQGGGIKRYGSPTRIDVVLESLAGPDATRSPADKRAEDRLRQHQSGERLLGERKRPTKSGKKPARLQAAIDAAIAKGERR